MYVCLCFPSLGGDYSAISLCRCKTKKKQHISSGVAAAATVTKACNFTGTATYNIVREGDRREFTTKH